MRIYVADWGSSQRRIDYCLENNIGLLISAARPQQPRGPDYIVDNGAFTSWIRGTEWDEGAFYTLLASLPHDPYFVVVPDIVAGGETSLYHSLNHADRIDYPRYLAVQDGMSPAMIAQFLDPFDGLFIGGSIPWKWRTAGMWATFAHQHGMKCHIGRCGCKAGYSAAEALGADSVDGSTPMRHDKLHVIPEWRADQQQRHLINKEEWLMSVGHSIYLDDLKCERVCGDQHGI